eukprot:gene23850-biopygen23856
MVHPPTMPHGAHGTSMGVDIRHISFVGERWSGCRRKGFGYEAEGAAAVRKGAAAVREGAAAEELGRAGPGRRRSKQHPPWAVCWCVCVFSVSLGAVPYPPCCSVLVCVSVLFCISHTVLCCLFCVAACWHFLRSLCCTALCFFVLPVPCRLVLCAA